MRTISIECHDGTAQNTILRDVATGEQLRNVVAILMSTIGVDGLSPGVWEASLRLVDVGSGRVPRPTTEERVLLVTAGRTVTVEVPREFRPTGVFLGRPR